MIKKLERDSLTSDLASVKGLLGLRTEDDDPLGWLQLTSRERELEGQLEALARVPETTAKVAVFFGGRPTFGSRGVLADFGGNAIEQFQAVVSTQYAALEGPIGARGPIPQRERAQLLLTDIARGSFGFVFEEAHSDGELLNTAVREAVGTVADLLVRVASPDEEAFEASVESIDSRVLTSITAFVRMLDDAGATLRIVEDERDFVLPRDALERARLRTESLEIAESSREVSGTLYILPDARRFELHPSDGSESYRGSVASELLNELVLANGELRPDTIGRTWLATLATREVRVRHRAPRYGYRLVRIAAPISG